MTLRWSHSVLYVRDLDDMVDFYTKVLGFEVSDRGPLGPPGSPDIVFMSQVDTDHHQIAFVGVRAGDQPSNSHNHMAFRVESLDEVRAYEAALRKDGRASDYDPMCHGNAWSVYFKDPNGNGLEIFCDTPFHVKQPQAKKWDLSWSDGELLEWTKKEFGDDSEFGPIEEYYKRRGEHLRSR